MKKKTKGPKKSSRKRSLLRDLKKVGTRVASKGRSLILGAWKALISNGLVKINLLVSLWLVYRMEELNDHLLGIEGAIMAAGLAAYVNTMVMFSAVSSELRSLLQLFTAGTTGS